MTITATVDRFEGDVAVLLFEGGKTVVNVSRSDLPERVEQGDVIRLEAVIDREETRRRREDVRAKIERLKRRSSDA
jgi:hypothetical protein